MKAEQMRAKSADELKEKIAKLKRSAKRPVLPLSGVTGEGVEAVTTELFRVIAEARAAEKAASEGIAVEGGDA